MLLLFLTLDAPPCSKLISCGKLCFCTLVSIALSALFTSPTVLDVSMLTLTNLVPILVAIYFLLCSFVCFPSFILCFNASFTFRIHIIVFAVMGFPTSGSAQDGILLIGSFGQSYSDNQRNSGPLIHLGFFMNLSALAPLVQSSAGFSLVPPYFHCDTFVASLILDVLLAT